MLSVMWPWLRSFARLWASDESIASPARVAKNSQWCLVGNIIEERSYGEGGNEIHRGTKHFSPGTKAYCLPAQWGDGYDQIIVIGRHRKSKQLKTMIISSRWVSNWRAKVLYNPEILRRISVATSEQGRQNWKSREE